MRLFSIVVLAVLLSGCASVPSAEERAAADYGAPISQSDAQRQARVALDHLLVDPVTARVDFGEVGPGWRRGGAFGDLEWGYRLPATVWARNGFGGGVGARAWEFMYRDGVLTGVWAERRFGNVLVSRRVYDPD